MGLAVDEPETGEKLKKKNPQKNSDAYLAINKK